MGTLLPPIPDRYEVLEELGRGGMGVVLRARDRELGREVALKLIHPGVLAGEHEARFRREARALIEVRHPRVVRLLDADLAGETPYLAMELLEGESLQARRVREGPMDASRVREITEALLEGLAAVHEAGLLHRDLKPANVYLDADRGPVLVDFGLALVGADLTGLTKTGALVGTPRYFAPELLRGEAATPASDLFALGMTAADLLLEVDLHTGAPRIARHDLAGILSSLGSGTYLDVGRPLLEAHGALGKVLLRALARRPEERFQDAAAMRAALPRKEGAPPSTDATREVPARPPPGPSPGTPGRARRGAGFLAFLALVGAAAFLPRSPPPAPAPAPPVATPPPDDRPLLRALQARPPKELLDATFALADLPTPEARTRRALELLAAAPAADLPETPRRAGDFAAEASSVTTLHAALVTRHLLARVRARGDPDLQAYLGWIPPEARPGALPPAGTRVLRDPELRWRGMAQRAPRPHDFMAGFQAGGVVRSQTHHVEVAPEDARAPAWLVLRTSPLRWSDVFDLELIGDRVTRLLPPPGRDDVATHALPAGLLHAGKNRFVVRYWSLDDPARIVPEVRALEVHLPPRRSEGTASAEVQ